MSYLFEIIVILVLIAINGYFALSEFAIISAKKVRLQQRAEEGDKQAEEAIRLADEPTPFLSTIQ
ncbi:MAG: CNNM domain-containing protein, partial [Methanoregulaceae archaeon]|nr:CNNM domain-containing protein [Methanoregulaceae archaeon]